jgi:two-component system, cell cycle sensor histidine kinase and response regulator CckA
MSLNADKAAESATRVLAEQNAPEIASVSVADAITPAPFSDEGQTGGAETILLVEDEKFVRKVAGEVLESAGYRLVSARCAADALEALRGEPEPIDLLLTDVVLPGKSGHQLAYEFHKLCPHARILLMSGYAEQLAFAGFSAQGRQYLAKPFSSRTLLRKVREALDGNPVGSEVPA